MVNRADWLFKSSPSAWPFDGVRRLNGPSSSAYRVYAPSSRSVNANSPNSSVTCPSADESPLVSIANKGTFTDDAELGNTELTNARMAAHVVGAAKASTACWIIDAIADSCTVDSACPFGSITPAALSSASEIAPVPVTAATAALTPRLMLRLIERFSPGSKHAASEAALRRVRGLVSLNATIESSLTVIIDRTVSR